MNGVTLYVLKGDFPTQPCARRQHGPVLSGCLLGPLSPAPPTKLLWVQNSEAVRARTLRPRIPCSKSLPPTQELDRSASLRLGFLICTMQSQSQCPRGGLLWGCWEGERGDEWKAFLRRQPTAHELQMLASPRLSRCLWEGSVGVSAFSTEVVRRGSLVRVCVGEYSSRVCVGDVWRGGLAGRVHLG